MFETLIERRAWVLIAFLAILAFSLVGISRLSIDANNRVFFSDHHPKYAALLSLEDSFGSNTELVYVLSSPEDLTESAALSQAIDWMADRVWTIEGVRSVDSLASFPHINVHDDELTVEGVLEFACPRGVCESSKVQDLAPDFLVGRLIAKDLSNAAVVGRVDLSGYADLDVLRIAEDAKRLKEEFSLEFPGIEIFLTGGVPMMDAFFAAAASDSAFLMPAALLLMFGALMLFLGSALQALLLSVLGLASVIITMGLVGWVGLPLNTATATAPLIIFTLVTASAMHLFMHVSTRQLGLSVESVASIVIAAARSNLVPMVLTSVTTIFGFASMIFVSSPPVRELGVISAIGITVGTLLSLLVLPGGFVAFPRCISSGARVDLQGLINKYAKWMEASRPNFTLPIAVLCVAMLGLTKVSFDEDFVRYFSMDSDFRSDTQEIAKVLAGPYHLDVVYDSGESAGIYSNDVIRRLYEISDYFERDERVVNVFSITDVLEKISAAIAPGTRLEEVEPDRLAQFFLTYELSLDRGQSTTDFVDADHRLARTSILLRDVSMAEIRSLVEEAEEWIRREMPEADVTISGEGVPTAYLSGESITEMASGVLLSILMSALIVAVFLRRLSAALVVLAATVVPVVAGFGIWGWLGGDIGMAATLVIATTIGIVVDDTIHLAYRFYDGQKTHDLTPWGASAYSLHKTGPALVATSVGLSVGFSVLTLSEFQMNATFGICTSIVIILALGFNLSVSPRLLRLLS